MIKTNQPNIPVISMLIICTAGLWASTSQRATSNGQHTDKQIAKLDLAKYHDDSDKGLILEVDLEYPEELHELHNDYPLASEKVKVTENILSDYS